MIINNIIYKTIINIFELITIMNLINYYLKDMKYKTIVD